MAESDHDEILDPSLKPAEREELMDTARLLDRERPLPRAAFRGQVGRRLLVRPDSPQRLRLLIAAYAGSGVALLALTAVGLAGAGPLAS